jgi:hypothetical protein
MFGIEQLRAEMRSDWLCCPPLSRPFRAQKLLRMHTQGITHSRSALGWVLKAFQAIMVAVLESTF